MFSYLLFAVYMLAAGRLFFVAHLFSCRYDDLKTAQDNIDLQTTILSRFDLIFIVKDLVSAEDDMRIARCVLERSGRCAVGQCVVDG